MNDASAQTSIEAVGLTKVYWDGTRQLEVIRDVHLAVRKGEGVAVLGPSGSGKTTLLNLLSGLDRPDSGAVRLAGTDLGTLSETAKSGLRNRAIGFVFQFYHLLSEFTALENVMLPALIGGRPAAAARSRAEALLGRVGLGERLRHFPGELSGGEQQRVAIARALVNDPEILFCDEPTGNLDPGTAADITGLLAELFREGRKTVVVVTHDERIAKITDRTWSIVKRDWV